MKAKQLLSTLIFTALSTYAGSAFAIDEGNVYTRVAEGRAIDCVTLQTEYNGASGTIYWYDLNIGNGVGSCRNPNGRRISVTNSCKSSRGPYVRVVTVGSQKGNRALVTSGNYTVKCTIAAASFI